MPTLADLMAESDLLGPLAPDERGVFAEHFEAANYQTGEILVQQNEPPEAIFLIASGTVDVTRRTRTARVCCYGPARPIASRRCQ